MHFPPIDYCEYLTHSSRFTHVHTIYAQCAVWYSPVFFGIFLRYTGCHPLGRHRLLYHLFPPPPPPRLYHTSPLQTDTCANINLPRTSYAVGNQKWSSKTGSTGGGSGIRQYSPPGGQATTSVDCSLWEYYSCIYARLDRLECGGWLHIKEIPRTPNIHSGISYRRFTAQPSVPAQRVLSELPVRYCGGEMNLHLNGLYVADVCEPSTPAHTNR